MCVNCYLRVCCTCARVASEVTICRACCPPPVIGTADVVVPPGRLPRVFVSVVVFVLSVWLRLLRKYD
jgi:hypothetical protein